MFGKGRETLLLSELLKDWPCTILQGSIRRTVDGITESSKRVKKDYVFVAKKGVMADGMAFIEEAIVNGAKTLVIDRDNLDLTRIPSEITVVLIPDSSLFISYGSAKFSDNPAEELFIIGVTGTNGKTTVSHFIGQLLKEMGHKTAVIGTTGLYIDGKLAESIQNSMTTIPAEQFHPILRRCINQQVTHVVLEASSIGLSTNRLAHCPLTVGVFLNIGMDHYAEHGGRQPYIDAKKLLISLADQLVMNEDDETIHAIGEELSETPIYFSRRHINGKLQQKVLLPNLGHHNEMNARAAIAALTALGYSLGVIKPHLHALRLPIGRLEKYEEAGVEVYVDYAHTPDALQAVLEALSESSKRLTTVFGCGGERDREKRPQMGAVAAHYSSHVILTSDNPRTEEPSQIIVDILAGMVGFATPVEIFVNRHQAIRYAITQAQPGEIVLIAGKGHEQIQQIENQTMHFCDMEEVKKSFSYRNTKN
ncbi:UDP-N-acetylmuramoyl-L-alanyl-D-glutamate--2,6-diaminopimelate ligase [Sporosarcina sp. P20a]|uniref:UDP-N-acetylmuramoyl-L-alanyl-D-glutamate--2, 6-diaminopimelate ligase n=1 Tax=Sporosarcina sp. P20a TaxID=2048256 RepID=UPI000C167E5F|nr:UDP-N-acetylmuramoyl-L-alanyl-D-glutamate--2,6-diaminopimelate ligase [Sporosarcina sp. P20a]PIC86513.1 UDP-N-acetylmuramoyl-L-alanyl-D-glutamate--2,6-diaminopimelate ligase [Sporosarcina sp. P20a]